MFLSEKQSSVVVTNHSVCHVYGHVRLAFMEYIKFLARCLLALLQSSLYLYISTFQRFKNQVHVAVRGAQIDELCITCSSLFHFAQLKCSKSPLLVYAYDSKYWKSPEMVRRRMKASIISSASLLTRTQPLSLSNIQKAMSTRDVISGRRNHSKYNFNHLT
jgi:hypothetical protein